MIFHRNWRSLADPWSEIRTFCHHMKMEGALWLGLDRTGMRRCEFGLLSVLSLLWVCYHLVVER